MYLQLAENSNQNNMIENYTPVETNQGVMYVRNDLLSETTLAAGGKIKGIVGKVAGVVAKSGIPLVSTAAGVVQKVAQLAPSDLDVKLKGSIQKFKAAQAAKTAAPVATTIIPEVVTAADVIKTSRPMAREIEQPGSTDTNLDGTPKTFYQKYKLPILIGGGIVVAGTLAYILTRKKRR
jgi:hypothetical protein